MVTGVVLLLLGLSATLATVQAPVSYYDEGIVLTGADLILRGKTPYREFYSNYPPGVFLLAAVSFKTFGASVAAERILGLTLHLLVALGAGRLAGRLANERFSPIAAGIALLWLSLLGPSASAWLAGLGVALVAIEAWLLAQKRAKPAAYFGAGIVFGCVSYFRHDLLLYWTPLLGVLGTLWILHSRKHGSAMPAVRACLWTSAGAAVAICVFWAPMLAVAGVDRTVADICIDQFRYTMPARRLPLPKLWTMAWAPPLPLPLPVFLHVAFPAAVTLILIAPALTAVAWFKRGHFGLKNPSALLLIGALSVAVLPAALGRTDLSHTVYTVTPAIVIGTAGLLHGVRALASRWARWTCLGLGFFWLLFPLRNLPISGRAAAPPSWPHSDLARSSGVLEPALEDRRAVLAIVHAETRPGEPIYVGPNDHRWIMANEMDLYFFADRPGSTRYMQLDPNIVTRADVQREMIDEMERDQLKVAILSSRGARSFEPNESRIMGSSVLDEYLAQRFRVELRTGPYTVLVRKTTATR